MAAPAAGARAQDDSADVLRRLAAVLESRQQAPPDSSYVARLYAQGANAVLKKIGEEAAETLLAAKDNDAAALIHEIADLWFHTLILLNQHGLGPDAVLQELQCRFGVSGLTEKAARAQTADG